MEKLHYMLHEELLYQWISVQHFHILLAIIQKLLGHSYLLYLLTVGMLQCQQSRRMQNSHHRCLNLHSQIGEMHFTRATSGHYRATAVLT